jgi:hypothetical protein
MVPMFRRIMMLLTVALVVATVTAVTAGTAFATGGGAPDEHQCNPEGTVCHGGGATDQPVCEIDENGQVVGECTRYPVGSGSRSTYDPATGDGTDSGGGGGQRLGTDENGQPVRDPGGSGYHCEYNTNTGEQNCVGSIAK